MGPHSTALQLQGCQQLRKESIFLVNTSIFHLLQHHCHSTASRYSNHFCIHLLNLLYDIEATGISSQPSTLVLQDCHSCCDQSRCRHSRTSIARLRLPTTATHYKNLAPLTAMAVLRLSSLFPASPSRFLYTSLPTGSSRQASRCTSSSTAYINATATDKI